MNFNGVPIVGQSATSIPAQLRLDASELVGKALEKLKGMNLRFGRLQLIVPFEAQSAQFVLTLEALEKADCKIVQIVEHLMPNGGVDGPPIVVINVHYRAPDALFTGVSA